MSDLARGRVLDRGSPSWECNRPRNAGQMLFRSSSSALEGPRAISLTLGAGLGSRTLVRTGSPGW